MAYLLDANVFIQAKNLHYGLDFCPAFWKWLIANNAGGNVFSIEKVGDEIAAGGDDRSDWAAQRGDGFFLKPDAALLPALGSVSAWANGQNYEPAAVNTSFRWQTYLVAHALAHRHTVVTHEIISASTKRIKIPNACIGLSIKFMTPCAMLRYERARFILGPQPRPRNCSCSGSDAKPPSIHNYLNLLKKLMFLNFAGPQAAADTQRRQALRNRRRGQSNPRRTQKKPPPKSLGRRLVMLAVR